MRLDNKSDIITKSVIIVLMISSRLAHINIFLFNLLPIFDYTLEFKFI